MNRTYSESVSTNKNDRLNAALKKLESGVHVFQNSDEYREYLKVMGKFHNYSFSNSFLIFLQKPEATRCAGYTTWKELGRTVKEGEKGITILAPAFKKIEVELKDNDGHPVLDADGNPKTEIKMIPNYRAATTFDISQTEGEPLPEIGAELVGEVQDYQKLFDAIKEVAEAKGVSVGFEDIDTGAKGYYNLIEDRIAINSGMSEVQNIKTLLHELAHSRLDRTELKDDKELKADLFGQEVRAESCAFVVADHFGIDTSEYSFPYVTSWSTDKSLKELRGQMDNIRKAASEIITETEEILKRGMEQVNTIEKSLAVIPPSASETRLSKYRARQTMQPVLTR